MIAGFETPDEGEIWLNGARIDALPPYRRNVNTVFQSYALFPHLTVRGNVEFGLRRKNAAGIEARVRAVLEQVRLPTRPRACPRNSPEASVSAPHPRGRWCRPDALLLDEPLSALDPQLRKQVRAELKDPQRHAGVTFLFTTTIRRSAVSLRLDRGDASRPSGASRLAARSLPLSEDAFRCQPSRHHELDRQSRPASRSDANRQESTATSRRATVAGSPSNAAHVEATLEGGESCTIQTSVLYQAGDVVHLD